MISAVKLSLALDAYRAELCRIVAARRGLNPRVLGSDLRRDDTETALASKNLERSSET